nr:MAG TPA: hypothetical protein [Caudoviricetes sp.]
MPVRHKSSLALLPEGKQRLKEKLVHAILKTKQ